MFQRSRITIAEQVSPLRPRGDRRAIAGGLAPNVPTRMLVISWRSESIGGVNGDRCSSPR